MTLDRLSELAGISPRFRDALGEERAVGDVTRRALLAAMGLPAASRRDIVDSIQRIENAPWRRLIDPVIVARRGERLSAAITLPGARGGARLSWRIDLEGGGRRDGAVAFADLTQVDERAIGRQRIERRQLGLPALPVGYHTLTVAADEEARALVIVAPRRCFAPPPGRRLWGIATQLYSLRTARDRGVGDFSSLSRLLALAGRLGADAVGLNPLHALFPEDASRISPYAPSDRRFLTLANIDVAAVPEFMTCGEARRLAGRAGRPPGDLVDFAAVTAFKRPILERLHRAFRERHLGPELTARGRAFGAFLREGGAALERFAVFQALSEDHRGRAWWDWPAELRRADGPAIRDYAQARAERVEFFQFTQFLAETQLAAAAARARRAGMAIGLYHDLALAAEAAGAEAWMNQDTIARGVRLGAPPDDWNHRGQDWGMPPYNPLALREAAFAPTIEVLRANMRRGGALRIDHVMGLERMFWIPPGGEPKDGAYVRYPGAELTAILALESARQRCVVIGEDLGTVPEGFRERMRKAGVLSYRLLYFTRDASGFVSPRRYPRSALVAVTTHDLATLPGFWRGRDLGWRERLDLYPSREFGRKARARREGDRRELIAAFKREGLLPRTFPEDREDCPPELVRAAYRFLARTKSALLMVQLEDVLGIEEQINVPGTVDEHPNWRRRLPLDLAALARDKRLRLIAAAIVKERGT